MPRIHILGASGSGTTTLGAALAARLGVPHIDSDTHFWTWTDPPYAIPSPPDARNAGLTAALLAAPDFVHSGATIGWGVAFDHLYTLIVFLTLDPAERMRRLRAREEARFGPRIRPGGDMHAGSVEFLEWAERYDTAGTEQRSLAQQEEWLSRRPAPVLRLDSRQAPETLVAAVLARMEGGSGR